MNLVLASLCRKPKNIVRFCMRPLSPNLQIIKNYHDFFSFRVSLTQLLEESYAFCLDANHRIQTIDSLL